VVIFMITRHANQSLLLLIATNAMADHLLAYDTSVIEQSKLVNAKDALNAIIYGFALSAVLD